MNNCFEEILAQRLAARRPALPLGTMTRWGKISAVGVTGGERYYWMVNGRSVAMMPADVVEPPAKID